MAALHTQPEAREVVIGRAEHLRRAEANGTYDQTLAMLIHS